MKKISLLCVLILFISGKIVGDEKTRPLSPDGPYLFYNADSSVRMIQIYNDGHIKDTICYNIPDSLNIEIHDTQGKYNFNFTISSNINDILIPAYKYKQADSIFVISDIHGRLDLFVELLVSHNIIDKNLQWNFGSNQLLILGDIFDRGDDVTQIFWLVVKLEQEAKKTGGSVSFILGNHETMILAGDIRYATEKYRLVSDTLNLALNELYAKNTWLGKWIASKNTIEISGDYMFVHAGISEDLCDKYKDPAIVNGVIRNNLFYSKQQKKEMSDTVKFMFGNKGPVWYRGMVRNEQKYNPITDSALKKIKKQYNVKHIIVGHTIMDDVCEFFNGSVIAVNVDNKKNFIENKSRGLLLTDKSRHIIYNNQFSK